MNKVKYVLGIILIQMVVIPGHLNAQNSVVLNGAYIVLNGGTAANNINLVVDQPNPNGIVRMAGGHIHSENQYNVVKWLCGASTGAFVFHFGVDGTAGDYIPFTFDKTAGNSDVSMSTWTTSNTNLPKPMASNVAGVTSMTDVTDSVDFALDRFWDIQATSTTADLTFSYRGIENSTASPTDEIKAQHWNGTSWDAAVGPGDIGVSTGIGTAGPITGQSSFSPWVLITVCDSSFVPTSITGTSTICSGASTILTLSGGHQGSGATAEWYSGSCGGTSVGTGNSINVSPTANTTYYVRYEGSCNTTTCVSQLVTVNQSSSVPTGITGVTTICPGSSTTLTLSGGSAGTGATAQWYSGSCGGTSVGSGNSVTVTPAVTTTYFVRYEGTCNTTTCASQTVTVSGSSGTAPTGITGTSTICSGASTTLTVSGGSPGPGATTEWYSGTCGGTPVGTGNSINVSPTTNTTYFVRYEGACNSTTCASQLVTVNQSSSAPTGITGITSICSGSSTTLTLSGGSAGTAATAEWYSGSCGGTPVGSGNSINVSPTTNTTYYVRYEGSCNSTACASQMVTVSASTGTAPTGITGTNTICSGQSTTLTVSGGAPGASSTTEWYSGSCGGTLEGSGNSITVSPTTNTTYFVRYESGCGVTTCASQLVTVNPTPTPVITGDLTYCEGQMATLSTGSFSTYAWSNGATTQSTTVTEADNSITVLVTFVNGCTGTSSPVNVNEVLHATGVDVQTACETYTWIDGITYTSNTNSATYTYPGGASNGCDSIVTLNLTILTPTTTTNTYTECEGFSVTVGPNTYNTTGIYTDELSDCETIITDLTIFPAPVLTISKTNENCKEEDGSIIASVINSSSSVSYLWNTGEIDSALYNLPQGTYKVKVTDGNNCTDSSVVEIIDLTIGCDYFVYLPNAFTPNGDKNNDVLFVRGKGVESFRLNIYNRWGNKIFESDDLKTGWDGTYRGEIQNTAVFVYTIEGVFDNGADFKQSGDISLFR
jgi:gliding motility-associated-like protein